MAELDELKARRSEVLAELSRIDNRMRALLAPPAPVKHSRMFRCSCGIEFYSWIERALHVDTFANDSHRDAGEIIDGRLVTRDETIVGSPVVKQGPRVKNVLDDLDVA